MYILLLFLLVTTSSAKLVLDEPATYCITDNRHYWDTLFAHFSEVSLITINILHTDEHHNDMSLLIDQVFKHIINFKRPVHVKHMLPMQRKFGHRFFGRNAFVIVVWNHEVLSKFLDVIPDEVVRDKRAKYAVLFAHNSKFDENGAHVLARFWKEFGIVNVCIHVPCSCQSNEIYQYHPFYKRINVINTTQVEKTPTVLTVSLKNLHQYPIKVSMFERKPTAIKAENDAILKSFPQSKAVYGGVDGCIIHTLSKVLNFTPIYEGTDYFQYGRILDNGTAVGSLGDVVYRRVQIAGNGRFVEDYGTTAFEFLTPYQNDYICFVVPKSQKIPQWVMLFHCFSPVAWLALIGAFTIATLTWKALRGQPLQFYAIFVSTPTNLTVQKRQKLFLFFCMLYNLIVMGIFQGSLTTSFSTISYYPDVTSLEGLVATGLAISSNVDVWKDDNSSVAAILKSRQRPTNGERAIQRAALLKDVAAVERRSDANYYIKEQFLDDNGLPLVHIVEECATAHFISFIVPAGSPFLRNFNGVIKMLNEGGFSKKWYEDMTGSVVYGGTAPALRTIDNKKALGLHDVQTVFYILVLGLGAAFFVFIGEVLYYRRKSRRLAISDDTTHFDFVL